MKTTPVRRTGASPQNESDTSAPHWCRGAKKAIKRLAAALLALQPGHNAATPTKTRQGSLVSADALPPFDGVS
jgi:hypothetical protein